MGHRIVDEVLYQARLVGKTLLFVYFPVMASLTLVHFPYDTDSSNSGQVDRKRSVAFYEAAYTRNDTRRLGLDYEEAARQAALTAHVEDTMRQYVKLYGLGNKRVLEVGSGRGYLQDIVPDYTGLDISPAVASRYHKPFVAASATAMPFPDNSFDGIWTIWVLEHIPEPERALREMRRVLKPNGILLLAVAWDCTSWAADGFDVRPYSDFNWRGRLVKASLPVRSSPYFIVLYRLPTRGIRWLHYQLMGESARLRFSRLEPNYEIYWQPDSDAAVSVDRFETLQWFRARGDECLNCQAGGVQELVLRIRK